MTGKIPEIIGEYKIKCTEMMFYMYLPIKLSGNLDIMTPSRLHTFNKLIKAAILREDVKTITQKYIYLTVKHLYVQPGYSGQRGGYHIDGFNTDDINYIWYDSYPTVFCTQEFNLSDDHETSIKQMEEQAKEENEITFPANTLLRLDQTQVHKAPEIDKAGMRTFVKISFSKHKYNLEGNAYNHLLKYNWKMHPRGEVRNHPTKANSDFV